MVCGTVLLEMRNTKRRFEMKKPEMKKMVEKVAKGGKKAVKEDMKMDREEMKKMEHRTERKKK